MASEDKQSKSSKERHEEEYRLKRLLKSFGPSLTVENLLGIFRFEPQQANNVTLARRSMKFLSFFTSTSMIAAYIVFRKFPTAVLGVAYEFSFVRELPDIVILAQYGVTHLSAILFHNRENMTIFKELYRFDTYMNLNVIDELYKKIRRETTLIFVLLLLVHIVLNFCDILSDGVITVSGLLLIIIYFYQDLQIVIFYELISMINMRLTLLKNTVEVFKRRNEIINLRATRDYENQNFSMTDASTNLNVLATLYDKIGEICYLVNDLFNFQVFMTLVSTFTYLIITIWSTLQYFTFNKEDTDNLISIFIWCVRCFCVILMSCLVCEKLRSTRIETRILVNDIIMDYDQPPQVRLQAKAFMELIDAWTLNISVYDMFCVDVTLIIKFISVATTYLIVIVQISHFVS